MNLTGEFPEERKGSNQKKKTNKKHLWGENGYISGTTQFKFFFRSPDSVYLA